jgi:hypothetical protein
VLDNKNLKSYNKGTETTKQQILRKKEVLNMAEKKITIVDRLNEIKAFLVEKGATEEMVAFVDERIEAQVKKAEGRKASADKKKAEADEPLKARVLEILGAGAEEGMTATEILNEDVETFKTVQKVTAIVALLKAEGKVEKVADKKRTLVKLIK